MRVRDVQRIIERWAPREIAWERDNVGLQCGDPDAAVRRVLVCLDVTEEVVAEARRKRANLLICHHPLLFRPVGSVTTASSAGRCLQALITNGIALLAVHTNLDFASGGTSFALAAALGLQETAFLHRPFRETRKLVTFVPPEHADAVARAMAEAGGGRIGNYEECSFRSEGTGTFRGNAASRPASGRPLRRETVREIRLEMAVPRWNVDAVTAALRRTHPYEEVAYDVVPSETATPEYGMGVMGRLPRPLALPPFLAHVKRALRTQALRYAGPPRRPIRRVAVCGGSGAELLPIAVAGGADAFVTADVKYHTFHEARTEIVLVDAGHFETEIPVVPALAARLRMELRRHAPGLPVGIAVTRTNPVQYV